MRSGTGRAATCARDLEDFCFVSACMSQNKPFTLKGATVNGFRCIFAGNCGESLQDLVQLPRLNTLQHRLLVGSVDL